MRDYVIGSFPEAILKIVVARHCQTDWNAENRVQGSVDTELNAEGRRQAEALADGLVGQGIGLIVSSTLVRAIQTAWVVAFRIRASLEVDHRLRECSFGSLEGLHFTEFVGRCGPANWADPSDALAYDFSPFGGDRGTEVFARQKELLDELKLAHDGRTVMIIGHGRSLRTLMAALGHGRKVAAQGDFFTIDY